MEGLRSKSMLGVMLVMALFTNQAFATQHVVGGSAGWDESTDYDSWAKGQTVKVGDTIVFKYTSGLHNVMELGSESEYKKCDTSNAANSMSTGNDVVKLDKAGSRYFACGTPGHCSAGMKLKIDVGSGSSSPSSSSTSSSSSDSDNDSSAYCSVASLSLLMAMLPVFVLCISFL